VRGRRLLVIWSRWSGERSFLSALFCARNARCVGYALIWIARGLPESNPKLHVRHGDTKRGVSPRRALLLFSSQSAGRLVLSPLFVSRHGVHSVACLRAAGPAEPAECSCVLGQLLRATCTCRKRSRAKGHLSPTRELNYRRVKRVRRTVLLSNSG